MTKERQKDAGCLHNIVEVGIMRFLIDLCKTIIKERKLLFSLSKDDFKLRFAGSKLGVIWGFISPFVTIILYWFVFQFGLRSGNVSNGMPYVLWLVSGILPWFFFNDAWVTTTNYLYEYSFLVKKVLFKVELLPIVKIMSALSIHIFLLDLCFILFATYGYKVNPYYLQVIYYIICEIVLVYAISLITSSIAVFIKDTIQFIGIVTQVLFWTIPIVWSPEFLGDSIILKILKLNPVYYLVSGFRDSFVDHVWFWDRPLYTVYFWVVTGILLFIGIRIYKKLNKYFADLL